MPDKVYTFEVTGGIDVSDKLKEERASNGDVCAFVLPDGRVVKPVFVLEVESEDGFEYIHDEQKMMDLGFSFLEYSRINFEDTGEVVHGS